MLKRKDLDETPIFKTEDLRNAFYEALHEAYRCLLYTSNPESFNSCSHGAGRVMSRAAAYRNLKREDMKNFLRAREVTLIGGTLDESPEVYKDINKVIAGQTDLVDVLAKFEPKVVRMAEEKAQWTQRRNKKKAAGEAEVCM